MVNITKNGIILSKTDLVFENSGVLNPAVIRINDKVHLFYRAVRQGNYSTIGYCILNGPLTVEKRFDLPILFPQGDFECHGIEDPRITLIDDLFYLSYTVYDGINALGAYAIAKVLPTFEKKGIISPGITYEEFNQLAGSRTPINDKYFRFNSKQLINEKTEIKHLLWDKNIVFFPRRIAGKLHFLHRIKPDIQMVSIQEMEDLTPAFWEEYFLHFDDHIILTPKYPHEISYIGGGCPPIETSQGWLLIYHGVHDTANGYHYVVCAALMDIDNPAIEIARLPYPLFYPDHTYEIFGSVNNVCFPTGTALFDDTLYVYYGAADIHIACASLSLSELLAELLSQKLSNHE